VCDPVRTYACGSCPCSWSRERAAVTHFCEGAWPRARVRERQRVVVVVVESVYFVLVFEQVGVGGCGSSGEAAAESVRPHRARKRWRSTLHTSLWPTLSSSSGAFALAAYSLCNGMRALAVPHNRCRGTTLTHTRHLLLLACVLWPRRSALHTAMAANFSRARLRVMAASLGWTLRSLARHMK
jgi:hypothetical protein